MIFYMELKNLNLPTRMLNALKKKHIHTVSDFLEWSPKKYLYFGEAKPIEYCQEDEYVAVKAKQLYVTTRFVNGKRKLFSRLNSSQVADSNLAQDYLRECMN